MNIEIKNLNKSFKNNHVLKNFCLNIENGDSLSILGQSGKGKSTILNILGFIDSYDSGIMLINGKKAPKINSQLAMLMRRYEIGYLFQNFALINNGSVEKNLLLALTYAKEMNKKNAVCEALDMVSLPRSILNKKIYELSGGEQQRIAIARMFIKPCDLVLADEPTGSLDPINKRCVIGLLEMLNKQGRTIIVVTHDNEVADFCRKTIILD